MIITSATISLTRQASAMTSGLVALDVGLKIITVAIQASLIDSKLHCRCFWIFISLCKVELRVTVE